MRSLSQHPGEAVLRSSLRGNIIARTLAGTKHVLRSAARLQLLLYAKKDLPLRDQIFLDKQADVE